MKSYPSTGDSSKDDIVACIIQLAQRAAELEHNALAGSLYTIAGASMDSKESELMLSVVLGEYARMRLLDAIDKSEKEHEQEPESDSN